MVVLPSFRFDHRAMETAFEPAFAGVADWSRMYVDLAGTGGSAPVAPNSDAVLDEVVSTLSSLLGSQRFMVVGWSYGGYLATGLIRRMTSQVSGLLAICAGTTTRTEARDLTGTLDSTPEPSWLSEVPADLHGHFATAIGCQTRAVATRVAAALAARGPMDEAFLGELQSSGYELSDEGSSEPYDGVATFLTGRRDRVAGFRGPFGSLTSFPRATFVAVADAGHYLPFERPRVLRSVLLDLLDRGSLGPPSA